MSRAGLWGLGLPALLLVGCPAQVAEPPPPMSRPEIPSAPPRALGALAAGTDAAPRPDAKLPDGEPTPGIPPTPADGLAPPGAAPAPDPESLLPAQPDAGMAL